MEFLKSLNIKSLGLALVPLSLCILTSNSFAAEKATSNTATATAATNGNKTTAKAAPTATTTAADNAENKETPQPQLSLKDKNLKDSEAFLAENKKKSDIITLASGLQYKIIKEGAGELPNASDFVTVNYRGTLIDGTEFDSSYKRGAPSTFAVNAIIPGWSEALQLMRPGSKWVLYIPPHLAYGDRGAGRLVGPNSALIFEVELLSAKSGEVSEETLSNEGEDG